MEGTVQKYRTIKQTTYMMLTDNNFLRPNFSMKRIEKILPGRLAIANINASAYGFLSPILTNNLVIHVDKP